MLVLASDLVGNWVLQASVLDGTTDGESEKNQFREGFPEWKAAGHPVEVPSEGALAPYKITRAECQISRD